jgi:hypothetical protein
MAIVSLPVLVHTSSPLGFLSPKPTMLTEAQVRRPWVITLSLPSGFYLEQISKPSTLVRPIAITGLVFGQAEISIALILKIH